MILAEKIINLRKKNGWSQEELADQLNISRQSVSKWESGASIPDLDRIIRMSAIFGVSTDYLLKDELEEITFSETDEVEEESGVRSVSLEEANDFMRLTKKLSGEIALAVSLFILSPVFLILMAGAAEYGKVPMTENMAGGLGVTVLLLFVAAGVAIVILRGMQLSKYEYMEQERLVLQYGVRGIVEKQKEIYEPVYRASIAGGVVLCIIGVVPLMLAAAVNAGKFSYVCCVAMLLVLVACGVYLFVRSGCIYGSFEKLLQEGDYTKEKKEMNRKTSAFSSVYWCLVTAIYLGISFYNNNWETSWIIWPVAGVLFAAVMGILSMIMKESSLSSK